MRRKRLSKRRREAERTYAYTHWLANREVVDAKRAMRREWRKAGIPDRADCEVCDAPRPWLMLDKGPDDEWIVSWLCRGCATLKRKAAEREARRLERAKAANVGGCASDGGGSQPD